MLLSEVEIERVCGPIWLLLLGVILLLGLGVTLFGHCEGINACGLLKLHRLLWLLVLHRLLWLIRELVLLHCCEGV